MLVEVCFFAAKAATHHGLVAVNEANREVIVESVPTQVVKEYPSRGPLQQFRFSDATAFKCSRCGDAKKSKLITVYLGDWSRRLCNGCYGRLLSIYEVKAGTKPDDDRADQLAALLTALLTADQQRQAEQLLRASENRAELLSPESLRFLATAEYVAAQLNARPELEWSPAVIGLCKAIETEIVDKIVRPLAKKAVGLDLSQDKADSQLGRVAAFCADPGRKPPELGSFRAFLQTVIHSENRRHTSPLIRTFLTLSKDWTGSHWILETKGLCGVLDTLGTQYRNKAAHIDELGIAEYRKCRELVIGPSGALWNLSMSVATK